ncbi:protein tyrosine phosphatase domain-containing protein 1-like [Anneissia japonica]|uniref:protein tyrosine phosphatase domain-containing protein 1-like n=1 Tax=Anneissia japonica TaxID=1529436 RepID=UPI001425732F|nr:protein tyrosine phosphatase domain-containing protein 1-like [Anneissia japonica]
MACSAPPNFSWVVANRLAAHALPETKQHLQYLFNIGVCHLVTLMSEGITPPIETVPELKWTRIPIEDFTPPSISQIETFVDIIDSASGVGEAVSVHCFRGRGRTGTMLASYLVKAEGISANDAIKKVRMMRPGSIETASQEDVVVKYSEFLKSKNHTRLSDSRDKVPPYFSWVVPSLLAAHAFPSEPSHLRYLSSVGIHHMISVATEQRPDIEQCPGMQWTSIGVDDFEAPNLDQVKQFIDIVEDAQQKQEVLSVHCQRGCGRTGSLLACYFVKTYCLRPEKAIEKIRELRHGSIETDEQQKIVHEYFEQLND